MTGNSESLAECPTVVTICGGQIFEAPTTIFALAPVLRDCISFCEEDSGTLNLDPLFFKPLKNGKFSRQVIGKHKLSDIGKDVAARLGLENPGTYTGHGWRRAAATEAANQVTVTLRPLKALLIAHVALNYEAYEARMHPDHFPVNLKKEIIHLLNIGRHFCGSKKETWLEEG